MRNSNLFSSRLSSLRSPVGLSVSLLLGSLLVFTACDSKNASSSNPPAPVAKESKAEAVVPPKPPEKVRLKRPAKPLNVILLTIDALRSDMPWAGYEKEIAPNLTKLAEEATVYKNHRSVSSYTAQTVATLMTGRYASTLYRTGVFFTNYFDSNQWITETMQSQGIRTMAVHAHLYFDRAPGLKQGFDEYKMVPGLTWNSQTDESVTSEKSIKEMMALLKNPENTKGQFFMWSHLMDPHDKYVKHKESPDFGKKNRGRYDSEVWFTDMWIGKLLEFARTQPWYENTAIIVSADHGEAFGEHDMYKHAFEIWDVLTRVPLIVKAPGAEPQVIEEARNHVDVAPTIVDLMGLEALEEFQGRSMVPEIYGEKAESREPILLELAEDTNNPARRGLVLGDYKLIVFDSGWKKMLFNLKDDPGELKDLSKEEPEKLKELYTLLKTEFKKLPVVRPFGGNKLSSGKIATGRKGPTAEQLAAKAKAKEEELKKAEPQKEPRDKAIEGAQPSSASRDDKKVDSQGPQTK